MAETVFILLGSVYRRTRLGEVLGFCVEKHRFLFYVFSGLGSLWDDILNTAIFLGKLDDADKASTAEAKCLLLKALIIKTEGRHLEDETKVRQALQITSS